MIDWLFEWGVANVIGFVFKEVLTDLAKDAARDFVKGFFKDNLNGDLKLADKKNLQVVAGQGITEFLKLVQQELEDADLDEGELQQYIQPFSQFIKDKTVQKILGSPFTSDNQLVDAKKLAKTWDYLNLLSLPDDFDWEIVYKRYLRKVKAILQESSELQAILGSVTQENTANGTITTGGSYDLLKYQKAIQEQYGNLRLDSLDTSGAAYDELRLWRIFVPQNVREVQEFLPQVYEIPKEYQKLLRKSGQLEEEELSLKELREYREVYERQPIGLVLDVVAENKYKYLVILGDPGSGKSTLLQYLALKWAESPFEELPLQPIALLIELRTYIRERDSGRCHSFLEFFQSESSIISHLNQEQLQKRLKAGDATVMFDGLDEVFDPGKREEVITEIIGFTQDYPNVRVVITSRVIGYKQKRLREAEFVHFMLQDLDPAQVDDFINRWHDLTFYDRVDKVRKRERLKKAIAESAAIRELSGNPLLLTMMAILNRNQELPRDRSELYNQSSRVLLHQWDIERALYDARLDPISLDYKDKQAMLRQVAYFMQANTQGLAGNSITAADLERILTDYLKTIQTLQGNNPRDIARVLIEQLRTRNFILCFLGADYYAFVHRTFLEYFCAWAFVWQFEKKRAIELEDLKIKVFGKHWQDESWHEVLQLIAGMIDAKFVGEILEFLIEQDGEKEKFFNLFLAAKCLTEVRNRSVILATATKLLQLLKGLTKYDLNYYYESWDDEAQLVREIRTKAVAAVAATWKDDPDTLPFLKGRALSDEDWRVRQAAVQELARGWKDDPDTLPFLKGRAQSDEDRYVRQAAVQELARGWKDDPDTLPFLKGRAQS
ncbi:MAG: NACHT domain-containing NTPase, partial [Xenococcaceae cyanobacterium]